MVFEFEIHTPPGLGSANVKRQRLIIATTFSLYFSVYIMTLAKDIHLKISEIERYQPDIIRGHAKYI